MLSILYNVLSMLNAEHAEHLPYDIISRAHEIVTWLSRQIITKGPNKFISSG